MDEEIKKKVKPVVTYRGVFERQDHLFLNARFGSFGHSGF